VFAKALISSCRLFDIFLSPALRKTKERKNPALGRVHHTCTQHKKIRKERTTYATMISPRFEKAAMTEEMVEKF